MSAATTSSTGTAEPGFALFDSAIGRCAIAWRGEVVIGFALPAASDDDLRQRCRWPATDEALPTSVMSAAIADIHSLLGGDPIDLRHIPVALSGMSVFERSVLSALRDVPPGATITYGALAKRVGSPGAARAVGMAMARNPIPVIIPCHRVLAGGGRSGGFSAPGGITTKFRLLQMEQAGRAGEGMLFETLPLAVKGPQQPDSQIKP